MLGRTLRKGEKYAERHTSSRISRRKEQRRGKRGRKRGRENGGESSRRKRGILSPGRREPRFKDGKNRPQTDESGGAAGGGAYSQERESRRGGRSFISQNYGKGRCVVLWGVGGSGLQEGAIRGGAFLVRRNPTNQVRNKINDVRAGMRYSLSQEERTKGECEAAEP